LLETSESFSLRALLGRPRVRIGLALAILITGVAAAIAAPRDEAPEFPIAAPPPPPPPVVEPAVIVPAEIPAAEPTPNLAAAADAAIERRIGALASELARMWTEEPERLVRVIDNASRSSEVSPPVTLLLAIAHAETNGKILDISEAAAIGLAQATPLAYLQEGYTGPLFVTNDYLVGVRAYITKKPLADADKIATLMLEKPESRARAGRLLASALRLRREGLEDLELLRGIAPEAFFAKVEAADRANEILLADLAKAVEKNDRARLREIRDLARSDYRALKRLQTASWKQYQVDLMAARDALLEKRFGVDAKTVKKTMRYEAAELLGRELDQRFSAEAMAGFLVRHLARKEAEALALGQPPERLEELTAALYNGGAHNVKRMLAGLIGSLPETENYSRKVPSTRERLDRTLEARMSAQ
jgi:hypothetical protein